jgi:two-component system response regulator YesN
MYNVMLVDDDYPVIELLSETIDWEGLGLRLTGTHENGLSAWEHAQREMPDIVITDIGMPKMNGLELIGRLKERKANMRVAILSCHSEFQYAQQAMRLNVQDYVLKDALDPADLERLLSRFKDSLDEEAQMNWQQSRLKHLVDGTKELRKEQWLKNLIHQPLLSPNEWLEEAHSYGLLMEEQACMPVIGFIEGYRQAKQRFLSDQTLRFAVNNVLEEVLQSLELPGVHAGYGIKKTFLLFSFRPGLKTNIYDQTEACLKAVQAALHKALKLRMSFILGESCASPEELKQNLNELLESGAQRFYLEAGDIVKKRPVSKPQKDLFAFYDQANTELREVLKGKDAGIVTTVVEHWVSFLKEQEYAPELVKDWMLKLLLDLKLKLQSLHFIRPGYSAETLHKEIVDMDSLTEMKYWLTDHLQSVVSLTGAGVRTGLRTEVMEACKYVSLHLDKRINLEEVAEHLYLNPSYFSRLFKKETGENFIEYVTRMKMERAKELLDQTSHSVGKICEMLGYDNQSYFIKIFKAHTGLTPVEYRG